MAREPPSPKAPQFSAHAIIDMVEFSGAFSFNSVVALAPLMGVISQT
jgi:hypothetical protein